MFTQTLYSGAWGQINAAYDQSVPKGNNKPVLIERKQVKDWIKKDLVII